MTPPASSARKAPITQISASAGSGKTYTITERFLGLLKDAREPGPEPGPSFGGAYSLQEILAATFTNKAAAEMKGRILSNLKQVALKELGGGLANGRANRLVSAILRHYDLLNVRTIDSLLNALVRLSALGLNLPPDFAPAFSSSEFYDPQYEKLMDILRKDDAEYSLLTAPASSLRKNLAQACDYLVRYVPTGSGSMAGFVPTPSSRLRRNLFEITAMFLLERPVPEADKEQVFARLNALYTDMRGKIRQLLTLIAEHELEANAIFLRFLGDCDRREPLQPLKDSAYLRKDSFDECLNKSSRGQAPQIVEWAFLQMKDSALAYSKGLRVYLSALQTLPLIPIARELAAIILKEERESGLLPAMRLPLLASRVLTTPESVSEALFRMGANLRHILLDEFQDTSHEQWAAIMPLALESLSQGGTLTYVGDVKQAIYNWRGGDAQLFNDVLQERELLAVAPFPNKDNLPCNWRSAPGVIKLNNAFFSQLADREAAREVFLAAMPTSIEAPAHYVEKAAELFSSTYEKAAQAIPDGKENDNDQGLVRLYAAVADNSQGLHELVHDRLQKLLFKELAGKREFGEIAVLVRAHDEAALVADWLTEWGVPVVTENSFRLAEHPLVKSLVAFLSFVDYPANDLAFWNCISTPDILPRLGGPAFAEITDWAARARAETTGQKGRSGRNRSPKKGQLYRLFMETFPEAWEAWFAPFVKEAGLMSVYDSSYEVIRRFKLDAAYPGQEAYLRRFLELAYLAEGRGISSLSAFLQLWEESGGEEKLPLPESMHAVRIMTIHQAKGLQFPVVILPFHHKQDASDRPLAITEYEGMPLLAPLGPELEEQYYQWRITSELERLNLIYVAWTRAVSELHVFITSSGKTAGMSVTGRIMRLLTERFRESAWSGLCEWEDLSPPRQENAEKPAAPGDAPDGIGQEQGQEQGQEPGHRQKQGHGQTNEQCNQPDGNGQAALQKTPTRSDFFEKTPSQPPENAHALTPTPSPPDSSWRPMAWLPGLKIFRSSLAETDLTPRRRGILAHLCLEYLRIDPSVSGLDKNEADQAVNLAVERAINQAMRLFPLPLAEPEKAADAMRRCLAWVAGLPETPLWLERGQSEQGIMDEEGRMFRVDLLVDEEENGLTAIEYKTGSPVPEHEEQVSGYLRLLAAACAHDSPRPVRGVIVYLDEQFMREVRL